MFLKMDVKEMEWRKIWQDNLNSDENGFERGKSPWYT